MPIIFFEKLKRREHSEYKGVDRKIILKWMLRKMGWKGVDWIHMAQDKNRWWAFMNTVMNF
jgi:hypothetical protein